MKYTIVIVGPPGAGKDTQARLLVEKLNFHLLNTGDLVRSHMENSDEIKMALQKGELVNDHIINNLVAQYVDKLNNTDRLVSDGFPRRLVQAKWFDDYLAESSRYVDQVIYIKIEPNESQRRLKIRHRHDDKVEVIKKRLDLFVRETCEVIAYYKQKGLVIEINGLNSVSEIHRKIVEVITK